MVVCQMTTQIGPRNVNLNNSRHAYFIRKNIENYVELLFHYINPFGTFQISVTKPHGKTQSNPLILPPPPLLKVVRTKLQKSNIEVTGVKVGSIITVQKWDAPDKKAHCMLTSITTNGYNKHFWLVPVSSL